MKRLNIITNPTAVDDLADYDSDDKYTNTWQLRAERLEAKRHRRFKQQLA
jgi:stress response protein YsnF